MERRLDLDGDMSMLAYIAECVHIEQENLNTELIEVSGHLSFWGQQLAVAEADLQRLKDGLDLVEAQAAELARTQCRIEDTKPTSDRVSELVLRSIKVQQAKEAVSSALEYRGRVKAIWLAVQTKSDMLVSLCANSRAEWKGERFLTDSNIRSNR